MGHPPSVYAVPRCIPLTRLTFPHSYRALPLQQPFGGDVSLSSRCRRRRARRCEHLTAVYRCKHATGRPEERPVAVQNARVLLQRADGPGLRLRWSGASATVAQDRMELHGNGAAWKDERRVGEARDSSRAKRHLDHLWSLPFHRQTVEVIAAHEALNLLVWEAGAGSIRHTDIDVAGP